MKLHGPDGMYELFRNHVKMSLPVILVILALMVRKLLDLGWQGWVGLVGLRTVLGTHQRRATDISHLKPFPPPGVQKMIRPLGDLGFQRLGESQLKLPFRPPATVWVLVDAEGKVQAETAGGRVSFSTFFQNNVLVVTDYPTGEHIETPTYQSHTITTGLKEAYQHHWAQVARFSQTYGAPHSLQSMNDYRYWETMGRTQPYGRMKLRRFFWIEIVRLAAFGYGVLIISLSLLFWVAPALFPAAWNLTREKVELLAIVLTLPATLIPDLYRRWMMAQTRRDSAAS